MTDTGKCELCPKLSPYRCSFCRAVYYCSKEHQKQDWKQHKTICMKQKYVFQRSESLGRHLLASESIKPEQILFKDNPLMLGPKLGTTLDPNEAASDRRFLYCLGCYKELGSWESTEDDPECEHCHLPICSSACSQQSWHSNYECRFLREVGTENDSSDSSDTTNVKSIDESDNVYNKVSIIQSLLYFRLFLSKYFNEANYKRIFELQSNVEYFDTLEHLEKTTRIFQDFKKILSSSKHPRINTISKPEIHQILGIVNTNGIEIQIDTNFYMIGLFPIYALLEHSCCPNTRVYFIPKSIGGIGSTIELYVRSTERIEPGHHLSTTYTNLLWNTEKRREDLKKRRHFLCNCPRCLDPTELGSNFSTIRCHNGKCTGYAVPIIKSEDSIQWKCSQCGKLTDSLQVGKVDKRLAELVSKLRPELEHYREMLRGMEDLVHPNYYLNFVINHSLIQLFGKDSQSRNDKIILDEKIKICNQLLGILKVLDPGLGNLHLYASVIYYELQSAILGLVGGEGDDDFHILRNHPESVKLAKLYLEKCIICFQHEYYTELPENKLKKLATKKLEYVNMIIKHFRK